MVLFFSSSFVLLSTIKCLPELSASCSPYPYDLVFFIPLLIPSSSPLVQCLYKIKKARCNENEKKELVNKIKEATHRKLLS